MDRVIRAAIVDDDLMLREGLAAWAANSADLRVVAQAATIDELPPEDLDGVDVVVLDLWLRDRSEPAVNVRRLTDLGHRVLVISVSPDLAQVAATFAAGARGYLTKDHDLAALAGAIREVAGGDTAFSPELAFACLRDPRSDRPRLSQRERAVLLAYASGMTLKATARHMGIKQDTAKKYLERVKAKYQRLGRPAQTKLELAERVREDDLHRTWGT